jgi:uncharacterized protein YecA (UPF0149 family)
MPCQFKIQLLHVSQPNVWRRVVVSEHATFREFHEIIQAAFGWDGSEDYEFTDVPSGDRAKIHICQFPISKNGYKGHTIELSEMFPATSSIFYLYDIEDRWLHQITCEGIIPETVDHATCIDGEGACPPEHCGGHAGLERLKQIMTNPEHPDYKLQRIEHKLQDGEDFEFHYFDRDQANRRIETAGRPFRNYREAEYTADDHKYGLTPQLWDCIDDIRTSIIQGKYNIVHKLKELTRQYPGIPHFSNSLASVFLKKKDSQRFLELTQETIANFPNYLTARTNLIAYYTSENRLDEALELLGKDLDLNSLYPDRNGYFTNTERYNYHAAAFHYLIATRNDNEAEKHLQLLELYHLEKTKESCLHPILMKLRLLKENEHKQRVPKEIPVPVAETDQAPTLTHPEVALLYTNDYRIDRSILLMIMQLPRESLISDLEKLLIDSIARFNHFADLDWEDETHSFPLHALSLLSALEAKEALETVIILMSQSDDYLDYWFDDRLTEEFYHFLYRIGQHRPAKLKEFILAPNLNTYVRTATSDAVLQIALHHPDRRQEQILWFEDVLQHMLQHIDDDNLFDTYLFASLIDDLTTIANRDCLPLIEKCYATGEVDKSIIGTLNFVKSKLYKKAANSAVKAIPATIDQFYDQWARWYNRVERNAEAAERPKLPKLPLPSRPATAKVGRNDPCPCGSGKKHKKCCGAA